MKRSFSSLQYSYDMMEDPTLQEPKEEKELCDEEYSEYIPQNDLNAMAEDAWVNDQVRKGLM